MVGYKRFFKFAISSNIRSIGFTRTDKIAHWVFFYRSSLLACWLVGSCPHECIKGIRGKVINPLPLSISIRLFSCLSSSFLAHHPLFFLPIPLHEHIILSPMITTPLLLFSHTTHTFPSTAVIITIPYTQTISLPRIFYV